MPESLDTIVERCRASLVAYQNADYAKQYTDLVARVLAAEQALHPDAKPRLTAKVAHSLHKLMAYKDEYEVARRSEEHTSELQSLMRISYAVFCLKKKNTNTTLKHYLSTTNNNEE